MINATDVVTNSPDIRDAILATNESFMEAFRSGDSARLAAFYTERAQFLQPNSDFVTGRQVIQRKFQEYLDMGCKELRLDTVEIEGACDTAYEIGRYTLKDEGGQMLDKGKFLVIWKHDGKQWRIHRDIINTSLPIPVYPKTGVKKKKSFVSTGRTLL